MLRLDEKSLIALNEVDEWAKKEGLMSYCERKPASLAIHWRGLDEKIADEIRTKTLNYWTSVAHGNRLSLLEFNGGIEILIAGRNKGDAVETVLSEMETGVVATYLGDDLTDEKAFEAIKGKGLGVLVGKEFHPTAALMWIKPPEELLDFLSRWRNNQGGRL